METGKSPESLFKPIDGHTLRSSIEQGLDGDPVSLSLTDGSFVMVVGGTEVLDDALAVKGIVHSEEWMVRVPFSVIASLQRWRGVKLDDDPHLESLRQAAFADLFEAADRHGFTKFNPGAKFAYNPSEPIRSRGLDPGFDQLLYADRDFFELKHRGDKGFSLGATLFGFGGDFGLTYDKSLADEIRKATKKKPKTRLQAVCESEDYVHLGGFMHVLPWTDKVEQLVDSYLDDWERFSIEAEGKSWYPALITASSDDPQPGDRPWSLGYLSRPGFRLPRASWPALRYPCRIYGQVMHESREFDLGTTNCFLFVRAVAFLKGDLAN